MCHMFLCIPHKFQICVGCRNLIVHQLQGISNCIINVQFLQSQFEMNKRCSLKLVTIWFRLIKPICDLELNIFGYCSIVFEPQKYFLILHLTHPKSQKLFKLVLK
jgi:hypothetical protein